VQDVLRIGVEGLDDVGIGVERQAHELGEGEDRMILRLILMLLEAAQPQQIFLGRDADPARILIAVRPRQAVGAAA
jgi:hypothetical protein